VGSTSYKTGTQGEWLNQFSTFFDEFPVHLSVRCYPPAKTLKDLNLRSYRWRVWKFNGDEILFQVPLTRYDAALLHVTALCQALLSSDRWSTDAYQVKLKATAWLAGFPITNSVVKVATDRTGDCRLDLVGL